MQSTTERKELTCTRFCLLLLFAISSACATVSLAAPVPEVPFAGKAELSVEALIEQVLARNPTLAQMVAA